MAQAPFTESQWAEIETVFLAASEIPSGAARDRFLRERCGADEWLRAEVSSLLQYDTGEESPLLEALKASATSVVGDNIEPGRMIGPWRIEQEIGRGGMAVVYRAVRADGEFSKRVAIKWIRHGMDTEAVVERLRRERSILAALEHPAIARLLDGGTTADGSPWIAMEYVEGVPIDRYCREHDLSVAERCRLIDRVCDGIAYAHRNLVIHRDLKPENILVGEDGNPKLLDFGIAKLLDTTETAIGASVGVASTEADSGATRGSFAPQTPRYASPEQRAGATVGTATDIYSLGLVLYELLAGRLPSRSAPSPASETALLTGEGRRAARSLAGDLDRILAKALETEPEKRYLSVEQMQSDLRRWLAGMTVSASPQTWRYRCGKFVRRHPVGAPAAALMLLAAVASAVTIVRAERKAEQRLSQLVELANTALFQIHGAIEHLPGATKARLEIVQSTLQYLDRLNAESGNDVRVLAALASAYARVGSVQGSPLQPNLGDMRGAEQSYVKAGRIFDSLLSARENPDLRLRDAEFRDTYGRLLDELNRKDDAIRQYDRGLSQTNLVLRSDAQNATARKLRVVLHLARGHITMYRDPAATRRGDLELQSFIEELVHDNPRDPECLIALADFWSQIGSTYEQEMNVSAAAAAFRRSTAMREQLIALEPQDVSIQHDLLVSWGHLGDLTGSPMFASVGDYAGAIALYEKAAAMAHQMALADPSNVQARNDEGTAMLRVGASQMAAGWYDDALQSLARAESLLSAQSNTSLISERLALIYEYRGRTYAALHDTSRAIDSLRRSFAACRALMKERPSPTCARTIWRDEIYFAPVLATSGDATGGLKLARTVLEEINHADRKESGLVQFRARALQANGAVHRVLAQQSDAGGTERSIAADYYRQAIALWRSFPQRALAPFREEIRQAEVELAEVDRR